MFRTITYNLILLAFICDKTRSQTETEATLNSIANGIAETLEEVDKQAGLLAKMSDYLINRLHVPGTKWCGSGNLSTSLNDLGNDKQTDICCRNHDLCPLSIKSGVKRFGLYNDGNFYRSHCNCDKAFYVCLKNSDHYMAELTGHLYFNILAPPCFKLEHPIVGCEYIDGKCTDYKLNMTEQKLYQWFENPIF